jgi:hypothetical protein
MGKLFSQRLSDFLIEQSCGNVAARLLVSVLLRYPQSTTGQSDNQRDTEK